MTSERFMMVIHRNCSKFTATMDFFNKFLSKTLNKKQAISGRFFFLHIPKTAGTTFRHVLYNNIEDTYIYPLQSHLRDQGGTYLSMHNIREKSPLILESGIIVGHYPIHFKDRLASDTQVITFIREPIERTKSHIRHIISQNTKFKNAQPKDVIKYCRPQLYNLQSRLLGYRPEHKNCESVINNINNLDFIGISEYFDSEIQRLNKHFGWQLRYDHTMDMNLSNNKTKVQFSKEDLKIIQSYNEVDSKIYNFTMTSKLSSHN